MPRLLGALLVSSMFLVVAWFAVLAVWANEGENLSPAYSYTDESSPLTGVETSGVKESAQFLPQKNSGEMSSAPDHNLHQNLPALSGFVRPKGSPARPFATERDGRLRLHWDALAAADLTRGFPPTFPENLLAADGQEISLKGFMTPFDQVGRANRFLLLEIPVGCFFCQAPSAGGIVLVELEKGTDTELTDHLVRVEGKLMLNRDDPEDFLFIVRDARIILAD